MSENIKIARKSKLCKKRLRLGVAFVALVIIAAFTIFVPKTATASAVFKEQNKETGLLEKIMNIFAVDNEDDIVKGNLGEQEYIIGIVKFVKDADGNFVFAGVTNIKILITRLIICIVVFVLIYFFVISRSGVLCMGDESAYIELNKNNIYELEAAIEDDLPMDEFDLTYEFAVDLEEFNVAIYCAKAEYLLYKVGVEGAIAYIREIIDLPLEGSKEKFAKLYCCYARCCMLKKQ